MLFHENNYLDALREINTTDFIPTIWLIDHFDLYNSTIHWPPGIPAQPRTNFIEGSFRKRFHMTYNEIMTEAGFDLDPKTKGLSFDK